MKREGLSVPLGLSFLADKVLLTLNREAGQRLDETQRHDVLVQGKDFLSLAEKGKNLLSQNLFDATLVDATHYYEMVFDTFSEPGESPQQEVVEEFLRNCIGVIDRLIQHQEVSPEDEERVVTFFRKIRDYSNQLLSKERTFERTSRVGDSVL